MLSRNDKKEIKDIKRLYYTYSRGYMMNAYYIFELKYENNKYIATIKPHGKSEEEKQTVEMNNKDIEKINQLLTENKVYKWKGFHKNNKHVLDGDSFTFNLKLEDMEIDASGYMMWPNNYRIVEEELTKIFMNYYKEN